LEKQVMLLAGYLLYSSAHMPYEIIHNLKDRFSNQKRSFTVRQLPSLGTDRIYAKEQALIDLVRDELAQDRPCVVYVRQTQTRDLQPRLAELLRSHVPDAKPYILKNTVAAERREATIEQQIKAGSNIIICNPELVKTGLDLIAFPTLIYYEISFNLSTMMQASARSYRLNQTHKLCKVYFLFYTETMEHHAVQLMSRKQRAAKLLNGEIGLTGLDALTEGEAGLEEELLRAIGREESLIDPNQLFKTDHVTSAIDAEDSLFWNVEAHAQDALNAEAALLTEAERDPLIAYALELGGTLRLEEAVKPVPKLEAAKPNLRLLPAAAKRSAQWHSAVREKLAELSLLNAERLSKVQARVLNALECGIHNPSDQSLMLFEGVNHPDFAKYPVHAEAMSRWLAKYLRSEKVVSPDQSADLATALVKLVQANDSTASSVLKRESPVSKASPKVRKKLDLLAVPEDALLPVARQVSKTKVASKRSKVNPEQPQQLSLFALPHVYA
jgi:hypothetical protein